MAIVAEPILASDLFTPIFSHEGDDSDDNNIELLLTKTRKLATNITRIDKILDGGFEFGASYCIVPDADQDIRAVIQTLLIAHLRTSSLATATLIESTSLFDVRRFYAALNKVGCRDGRTALQALEQLKITKVFDHIGAADAVKEIQDEMASAHATGEETPAVKAMPKSTIEDSEDEDEIPGLQEPSDQAVQQPLEDPQPLTEDEQEPRKLIIVDNVSQLFSPVIKNNYTAGQAALAEFMHQLSQVTRTQDACTILISNPGNMPASEREILSLFEVCNIHPALGVGFGSLVDTLIYLYSVPAKKATTEAEKHSGTRTMAGMFEVVQDRRGGGYGHYAPFQRTEDGNLKDFES